jgi:predicted Ser/Thr protein kinase
MPSAASLSSDDRRLLNAWLTEFDQGWHEKLLGSRVRVLPPQGKGLRLVALAEMVKLDLKHHWQRGHRVRLESYLRHFPELGTPETVPAELVHAEFEARRLAGKPKSGTALTRRFPRQADEVRRLLEESAAVPPPVPPASTPETVRPLASGPSAAGPTTVCFEIPEQFGRYQIRSLLGRGGMGAVYLAQDTALSRLVALKIPFFSAADDQEGLERFWREAQAAATLVHPNICPVYDVGTLDGVHFLTMAYVKGRALSVLVREDGPLPLKEAAQLVRKLAEALAEAHAHGIVHRDLKPSNILINARQEPVIMDFGLARRVNTEEARLTLDGGVLGTPAYMPPEQFCGTGQADGAAWDMYSLGVLLYELLTGRTPFEGPPLAMVGQALTQEPPRPSQYRPDLDANLEAVCLKAMARNPQDRCGSMSDLAAALTAYLHLEILQDPQTPSPPASPLPADAPSKARWSLPAWRWWWIAGIFAVVLGVVLVVALRRPSNQQSGQQKEPESPAGVANQE